MNKEYLEAWNFIKDQMQNFTFSHLVAEMVKNADIVEQALLRLKAIDNANPSEALKCLDTIKEENCCEDNSIGTIYYDECNTITQALQRLKAIDNAKPSEALEELEVLKELLNNFLKHKVIDKAFTTIKQYILKAQEQEKENAI